MKTLDCRPRGRWAFLAMMAALPALPLILVSIPSSSNASRSVGGALDLGPAVEPTPPAPIVEPLPAPATVSVSLHNVNTKEDASFDLPLDGQLDPDTARALGAFFRCKRTGRKGPLAQGTVVILADLARTFPGKTIHVVSGWRAPPHGAKHSKHFKGHAIDLRIPGVKTAKVRDHLWLKHHHVGVGYYPQQNFIHVDFRPTEKDIAWTSRREGAPNRYHPGWAKKLLPSRELHASRY